MDAIVCDGGAAARASFFRRAEKSIRSITSPKTTLPHIGSDEEELAMTLLRSFLADETGATAIEYGLIAAGIALAIVTVVNNTGSQLLNNKFNSISSSLK
ncbi:pilus assembly protein Flp/PilA [Bradyrhizobium japonicum]|nr:Flp pilus assembly pilin Flp [Bradyrhizobium japonicum]MCS3985275.1 Flp pilus assembly pilin Flp [Bradyrhizobium japonicum]MCS4019909.1 Flp pilus assembly pilin Flp [Bradyrhizobium japonicum]MCS4207017.1 Flp pilus assembly pilin Flp [Bradyrhizobium japonicum]MDH6175723.1 pilus assembly protein Flp/PilA [Bradyrhizobium japonicum]